MFLSTAPTPNTLHKNFGGTNWMCTIYTHAVNFLTPKVYSGERTWKLCNETAHADLNTDLIFNRKRFQFAHLAPLDGL